MIQAKKNENTQARHKPKTNSISLENIDTNKNESENMSDNEDEEEIFLNVSFIFIISVGDIFFIKSFLGLYFLLANTLISE